MNFLAHLALSGNRAEIMVGNLMGDFVKGRLDGRFPAGIQFGLELHRRIDRFAEDSEHFIRSRHRIDGRFGLFRGALVDLFYDHFLARNWRLYHQEPLLQFIDTSHRTVCRFSQVLPESLGQRLSELFGSWLPSYREVDGIDVVLKRMSARFKRQNPMAEGAGELQRNYLALAEDFLLFYPELQTHVENLLGSFQDNE
ncbi:acyl carrier protein phosphodiesterase [Geotalea toluenoxydans]